MHWNSRDSTEKARLTMHGECTPKILWNFFRKDLEDHGHSVEF